MLPMSIYGRLLGWLWRSPTKYPSKKSHSHGIRLWKNKSGFLHRDCGPAAEWPNGRKEWYLEGSYSREGGPIAEYHDGVLRWPSPIPDGWDRFTYGYSKMELYD